MTPIDVSELLENPGTDRVVHLDEPIEGLALEMASVDAPLDAGLRLASVSEGIFVSGDIRGGADLTCARCLETFASNFDVKVGELFHIDPGEEDDYAVTELGEIDLEPMIRDAVLLSMPFSPLCREDCKGLCPVCGSDRNQRECHSGDRSIDPRWAGLQQLVDND